MFHRVGNTRGIDPVGDFLRGRRVVVDHPRDLKEGDSTAVEDVGDFRNRTGLAPGQPVARHLRAVRHFVERGVIDGSAGLQVQDNDGNLGAADDGQDRRGKGIRGDIEEEQVHVRSAEVVARSQRFLRSVDEAKVDDINVGPPKRLCHRRKVPFETRFEPRELRPIRVEANAEDADLERAPNGVRHWLTSLRISKPRTRREDVHYHCTRLAT